MADLGDITNFITTAGAVSNLDWLDVDEQQYRELDTLPKQNLDTVPDLEALWSHKDEPSTNYVPNRGEQPRTMGDLSQEHGLLRAKPDDIRRVVRLALLQSPVPSKVASHLQLRFSKEDIRENRELIAEVLLERGLLGRYYIDSRDFSQCGTGSSKVIAFVKRYAAEAPYVLEKPQCSGCIHRHGGDFCSTFHKEIKVQIPYTDDLADKVERVQKAKGYTIEASSGDPKTRIRLAMLAPVMAATVSSSIKPKDNVLRLLRPVTGTEEIHVPVDLSSLRRKAKAAIGEGLGKGRLSVRDAQQGYRLVASATDEITLKQITAKALGLDLETLADQNLGRRVVAVLRREMLKGRSLVELQTSLRTAFSTEELDSTQVHWSPVLKEAGLYGTVYSTADSFGDCREGANLLATYNPNVKVVVAGVKCGGCEHNKVNRCALYGKPLVVSSDDIVTSETVSLVIHEHQKAGRLASCGPRITWGETPTEALQAIYQVTAGAQAAPSNRVDLQRAFYGMPTTPVTTTGTRREIVKATAHLLNQGLYGQDLLTSLKARFEVRDLKAAKEDLRPVLANQGLQGLYFIDPTVYDDYGRGCKEAARHHRSRLVKFAVVGAKCASCVHQTEPGHCSVLGKALVVEPPYPQDKKLIQREVLASGRSTEVNVASLVNNGLTMLQEYQLQKQAMEVDVDPVLEFHPVEVEFGKL